MTLTQYQELTPRVNTDAPLDIRLKEILNRQLKWGVNTYTVPTSWPNDEVTIRGAASVAFSLGVTVQTLAYDATISGVASASTATGRAVALIDGVASSHVSNGGAWGHGSQSSLWAGICGKAAALSGSSLSVTQWGRVLTMLESEADWLLTQNPRFMYDPTGTVLTPGNTGAEENAWQAMTPAVAYCMMPTHPHAQLWLAKAVEFWVSAYCHVDDLTDSTLVNGVPISTRVTGGYNVEPDWTVVNHDIAPNADYMSAVNLLGSSAVMFGLVGRPVPEACFWHYDRVYAQLSTPLPAFAGATMYLPGQPMPSVFYPSGNDWGTRRPDTFALADGQARAYDLDGLSYRPAGYWERVHLYDVYNQQLRYTTGQVYPSGSQSEFIYGAKEQWSGYLIADLRLAQWLSYWGRATTTTASI